MKVMIRKTAQGYSAYMAKKDLETGIVSHEKPELWGGTATLENGWVLKLPEMPADTRLPITVDAARIGGE